MLLRFAFVPLGLSLVPWSLSGGFVVCLGCMSWPVASCLFFCSLRLGSISLHLVYSGTRLLDEQVVHYEQVGTLI